MKLDENFPTCDTEQLKQIFETNEYGQNTNLVVYLMIIER